MATEKIVNNPTVTDSELANFARGLHHKRGQWLAAFYETAKKHGIDMEPIFREAIYNIGVEQAKAIPMYQEGKRYNFSLLAADPKCPRLAVAESPIDALSLATLVKLSGGEWRDSHYLSLGGTSSRAMIQFLHDHPHVTQVSLCLDNDNGGVKGMERLENAIREDPELSQRVKLIYRNPPPVEHGTDYNEFLCAHIQAVRQKQHHREGVR